MPTTNTNRKILDLKRWEMCCPHPSVTAAGAIIVSSRHFRQSQLYVRGVNDAWLYLPEEDGWTALPNPALGGTFGAGNCGTAVAMGPAGTATGGSTTTLATALTLARDLRGYSVRITGGPAAGDVRKIARNTVGANAVIEPTVPFSAAITAASTYQLITPRWYVLMGGTQAAGTFRYYDLATNTWTTAAITGLVASIGTEGRLVATPSWMDDAPLVFATGTASAATATTLQCAGKTWAAGQWVNSQVRIVSGTGAGQVRVISGSTSDTLTVPAWTVQPDATSAFAIEGCDDFIYFLGNNSNALYRYSISANTWTLITPAVARAGGVIAGGGAHWVWGVTDAAWADESAIVNGRRIYSFRGGSSALDYYDIAANTWVAVTYAPAAEAPAAGGGYAYNGDFIYVMNPTGRWWRYDIPRQELWGWGQHFYAHSTAQAGDRVFDVVFKDGGTEIVYIYAMVNNTQVMLRQMVI